MKEHKGRKKAVAFIDINADNNGACKCGINNQHIGLSVELEFSKAQLPWLTNWQHWGKNEYVTALEPCTHPPIGQSEAREKGTLLQLEVGETKAYDVKLSVNNFKRA